MAAQKELTTYIALFHDRETAASALHDLERLGFASDTITLIAGGSPNSNSAAPDAFGEGYEYGDQNRLAAIGVPLEDRNHLQNVLNDGGIVLALKGAGERANEIETIFSRHSTRKIDEKNIEDSSTGVPYAAAAAAFTDLEQTVIPVTQEDLVIGKREVDRGGIRVFRRIVEEPVSEAINLREEHVVIDRRPVDRAVTNNDLLTGEQVIELTETSEEATFSKTSRVVEEIRIGKTATEHTETIHDTVRHTEVDVEQLDSADLADSARKY